MSNKHTYCFIYNDINYNICYIWIEAINLDVAKIKFKDEAEDCFKLLEIQETFNWQ